MIYLVIGGSGSGKSRFAEDMACRLKIEYNAKKLLYIAAMMPYGDEAQKRIERHRKMRACKGFETIECYNDIDRLNVDADSIALLECIPNLAANEMFAVQSFNTAKKVVGGIVRLSGICKGIVAVSGNVFDDGILYDADTIRYMRALADINIHLALLADGVSEIVCGTELKIK